MMRGKAYDAGRAPPTVRHNQRGRRLLKGQASKILAAFFHAAALDAPRSLGAAWARKLTHRLPSASSTLIPALAPAGRTCPHGYHRR